MCQVLQSKLRLGILDQYLANFDIIVLSETNTDSPELLNTLLIKFVCFTKKNIIPVLSTNMVVSMAYVFL